MELNSNTGGQIDLEEAKSYVEQFKKRYPEEVKAFFIGSNQISKITSQAGCIGIRIYNGYESSEGRMNQIMVGVNEAGSDMTEGIILDRMAICPPNCDVKSPLMT